MKKLLQLDCFTSTIWKKNTCPEIQVKRELEVKAPPTVPWWPSGNRWITCCATRPACTQGCHGHVWCWLSAGSGCPTPAQQRSGMGGGEREERSTTTRRHWRDARRRCRLALRAATHDDGAVCRAAVQPVPVDKGKKISRVSSGTDVHLMMMFRVCVEKEKRKAQRYPCMHSANTIPSWPSRVFWHL